MSDVSYTVEEIAKLLKISKLTVYELVKKGELPAYRVGKQMRVDDVDLDAYKRRSKPTRHAAYASAPAPGSLSAAGLSTVAPSAARQLVITGQDVSLDLLARQLDKAAPGYRPLRSYASSMDSLVAMYRGEADIVSTHLLDGDTGEYNIPYVRKLLIGSSWTIVNLLARRAGLYVREGNPLGLADWTSLRGRSGLRVANRERGAGARVLLDEQLRLHGIEPSSLLGYETEHTNHLGVAGCIASGDADFGVGHEKAARLVGGIAFIPLAVERVDLVMLKKGNAEWVEAVLRILRSDSFRGELQAMGGYDLTQTGQVLYET
ncbi:MAG: helix-turn-helix transcriptional regulator [Paenibacillaceae bacterium]|nr:helix-turn-helix transcriptional regulator [Paenibacillaceae bacterium]